MDSFASSLYLKDKWLGEFEITAARKSSVRRSSFASGIRITHLSDASERLRPEVVLHIISDDGLFFKMTLKQDTKSEWHELNLMHSSCLSQAKTAVVRLDGWTEVHLVAVLSKSRKDHSISFWAFATRVGLYASSLGLLNTRSLGIVFDLDETLLVANTMRSFEDKVNALEKRVQLEADAGKRGMMSAELQRYMEDQALLHQYYEADEVVVNGVVMKAIAETVSPTGQGAVPFSRPVIHLQDNNIVLTRIDPAIRDTSVLVRFRPAWEELREYLIAKGRNRFEAFVCTMSEKEYALEMWRLLDPGGHLIPTKDMVDRVVCVKADSKKILSNVFHKSQCHPKMAMVVDDRLKVWDDKDQARVHVVPAFTPYYAPHAEASMALPVLAHVRNVACNVRGAFFREVDEFLVQQLLDVRFDAQEESLPRSPDAGFFVQMPLAFGDGSQGGVAVTAGQPGEGFPGTDVAMRPIPEEGSPLVETSNKPLSSTIEDISPGPPRPMQAAPGSAADQDMPGTKAADAGKLPLTAPSPNAQESWMSTQTLKGAVSAPQSMHTTTPEQPHLQQGIPSSKAAERPPNVDVEVALRSLPQELRAGLEKLNMSLEQQALVSKHLPLIQQLLAARSPGSSSALPQPELPYKRSFDHSCQVAAASVVWPETPLEKQESLPCYDYSPPSVPSHGQSHPADLSQTPSTSPPTYPQSSPASGVLATSAAHGMPALGLPASTQVSSLRPQTLAKGQTLSGTLSSSLHFTRSSPPQLPYQGSFDDSEMEEGELPEQAGEATPAIPALPAVGVAPPITLDADTRRRLLILEHGFDRGRASPTPPGHIDPRAPVMPPGGHHTASPNIQLSLPFTASTPLLVNPVIRNRPQAHTPSPRPLVPGGSLAVPMARPPVAIIPGGMPHRVSLQSTDKFSPEEATLRADAHHLVNGLSTGPLANASQASNWIPPSTQWGLAASPSLPRGAVSEGRGDVRMAQALHELEGKIGHLDNMNAISILNEASQKSRESIQYRTPVRLGTEGNSFSVEVNLDGQKLGEGFGRNKKDARLHAAESALTYLRGIEQQRQASLRAASATAQPPIVSASEEAYRRKGARDPRVAAGLAPQPPREPQKVGNEPLLARQLNAPAEVNSKAAFSPYQPSASAPFVSATAPAEQPIPGRDPLTAGISTDAALRSNGNLQAKGPLAPASGANFLPGAPPSLNFPSVEHWKQQTKASEPPEGKSSAFASLVGMCQAEGLLIELTELPLSVVHGSRQFSVQLAIGGQVVADGTGLSFANAREEAAAEALRIRALGSRKRTSQSTFMLEASKRPKLTGERHGECLEVENESRVSS